MCWSWSVGRLCLQLVATAMIAWMHAAVRRLCAWLDACAGVGRSVACAWLVATAMIAWMHAAVRRLCAWRCMCWSWSVGRLCLVGCDCHDCLKACGCSSVMCLACCIICFRFQCTGEVWLLCATHQELCNGRWHLATPTHSLCHYYYYYYSWMPGVLVTIIIITTTTTPGCQEY